MRRPLHPSVRRPLRPAVRRHVAVVSALALVALGPLSTAVAHAAAPAPPAAFTAYPVQWQAPDPKNPGQTQTVYLNGGEPSIGNNPASNAAIFGAGTSNKRLTWDDSVSPAPLTVADAKAPTSVTTLDAITFTDQTTGRTFISQLAGACSLMSYTDSDGRSWTPSTGCGPGSLLDHQSVGGGPWHAGVPVANPFYPDAVYYCAQNGFNAFCSVSHDGGVTFAPGVPVSDTPANATAEQAGLECAGEHGHVRVGGDGTAYLPIKDCGGTATPNNLTNSEFYGGRAAVSVSEDNGATWVVHTVPGSHSQDESDPSVDVDRGSGRVWLGWQDGTYATPGDDIHLGTESEAKISYSDNNGATWSTPYDVSSALGIHNVQFPEVIAGDHGRAAFAFLGTDAIGDDQHNTLFMTKGPGGTQPVWHLYVALTYDGGDTWTTIDTTPNDPVQRGCVDLQGTSNKTVTDKDVCSQRNLLDFNDITVDNRGRVLVAYSDGCVDACVTNPDPETTYKSSRDTVMRLSAGKGLFAAYDGTLGDVPAPTLPELPIAVLGPLAGSVVLGAAYLRGRRRHSAAHAGPAGPAGPAG